MSRRDGSAQGIRRQVLAKGKESKKGKSQITDTKSAGGRVLNALGSEPAPYLVALMPAAKIANSSFFFRALFLHSPGQGAWRIVFVLGLFS
jgi:hypothetical protein